MITTEYSTESKVNHYVLITFGIINSISTKVGGHMMNIVVNAQAIHCLRKFVHLKNESKNFRAKMVVSLFPNVMD
jgi:hypothetical protein